MATIRKIGNEYFLCKKKLGIYRGNHILQDKWTNIFRIKSGGYKNSACFNLSSKNTINAPHELFGEKIMLKVIVIEDKKRFKFENMKSEW